MKLAEGSKVGLARLVETKARTNSGKNVRFFFILCLVRLSDGLLLNEQSSAQKFYFD